ncbi:BTAD domain-containing putative transcriptional regulator [Stappia sp. ES.058]|uniref:BTAD domain-containing putative transcriptional regulator n=1 Tax=Stappia sp. ES.058 TaxID=1881061 RepID=UPI0008799ADE|nr:BTAD domain-containing putative transcriptional regulator [Stappia sp. ES.058]SDT97742.1 DNA-binding transcriptional activator of the SARP family [Stappia sp. ES.058]
MDNIGDNGKAEADMRASGPRSVLRGFVLGVPRFEVDGEPVIFRSRKAEGLLARLCLTPGGRLLRETAANLFWQDSSDHHARSSLRQTLLILRRVLESAGFHGLGGDKLNITLDLERVRTDIQDLFAVEGKVPRRLIDEKRLSERLIEGGETLSEPFTTWLRVCRQQFHDQLRGVLEPRIGLAGDDWQGIEDSACALLNLDPTHEPACRAFIAARAARGDYTSALRAYEELWNLLEEEFDTQPARETQNLIVNIKLGHFTDWLSDERARIAAESSGISAPRRPADSALGGATLDEVFAASDLPPSPFEPMLPAAHAPPVIVVDPVMHVTLSEEDTRLARVFRHDLISRLVRFREWSVADGLTEDLSQSRSPLYRVAISAMLSGRMLSYSVTVMNFRTNAYVWGRNSELDIDELFARQPGLVAEIALAMNVSISAERLANMSRIPDVSVEDCDRLLVAQRLHYTWRMENSDRAEQIVSGIIEENPGFGPAYSSLAQILNTRHIIFPGQGLQDKDLDRAAGLARVALSIDPFDPRAHLSSAWTAALQRRFAQAEAHHRQALALNDNDPWTSLSGAHGLAYFGHAAEAARIANTLRDSGLLTSPLHWSYFVGIMFLSGDHAAAINAFRYLEGGYLGVEVWYVAALALTGQEIEARMQRIHLEERVRERWVRPEPPTPAQIARWIGSCFPISDRATWDMLCDGLLRAGMTLPVDLAPQ